MRLKNVAVALSLLLLSSGIAYGLTNETVLKEKITAYMRKAFNIPANVKISVGHISASEVPGLDKSVVDVSIGERKQTQDIYISRNGKYLILGKVFNLNEDPLKETWSKITLNGSPVRGADHAKVTVVEFTDFECPYCGRAYSTVEDLLLKYAGKIKLVYKSYPLPMHPWAMKAAIGADCAYEQNHASFWYFYDHLFQEQGSITPDNVGDKLKGYAKDTKLNVAKFETCVEKQQTKPMVERDVKEANSIGVSATPTFVINGRIVQGAQPEEAFVQIINEILK
ncbi:MAG: thioredoxin domain-containing protein [Deltaproteobacteria bacterium]|nr:thioredoxin domain-containing protein [Deltaproteobacteria bacterium]